MIGCKDTRPTVQICLFNVIFQDFFFYLLVIQPTKLSFVVESSNAKSSGY